MPFLKRFGLMVGSAFSPLSLSPALWLKADAIVGLADGDPITTWTDSSGNGRNGTATGLARPIYKNNAFAALPCTRYDGANTFFGFASNFLITAVSATMIAALRVVDDPPAVEMGPPFYTDIGFAAYYLNNDTHIYDNFCSTTRQDSGDPTPLLTNAHIYSVVSATDDWRNYINGAHLYSKAINTVRANYGPRVGRGTIRFFAGDIAEIIVFATALSDANRQLCERYLGAKYSIALA